MTAKLNRTLKILFISNGIFVFAAGLLGPLYAVYLHSLSFDVLVISITWAVFLGSTFIFTFIVARIGDGLKRKKYWLLAGFLLRAIAWFSFIFVSDIQGIVLIQILLGLGEAVGSPAFDSIFAEHLDKGLHMRDYADWKLVANGTTAIGAVVGGVIVTTFGFDWLFGIMGILALISFWVLTSQPRNLFS